MKEKKLTGYPSIDNPQSINSTYFEKNPIIPNMDIYTTLKLLSSFYLNNSAIDCLDLKASYGQLLKDSVTISKALKELGVKKGDIISIAMPNFYQALAAFFACNRIGAVITFLDPSLGIDGIADYINLFESPIYINYDKNDDFNKKIKEKTNVKYIITLDRSKINTLNLNEKLSEKGYHIDFNMLGTIAKYKKRMLEFPHFGKENALILYTSGTTGKSKEVVLTNENVLAAEIYAKNTSHTENIKGPKTLVCVPFSYPYGLITSALTSLLWGKEAILAPDISKDTISYYYKKQPSIVFGSPALLDLTINNIPAKQDLSSVTHFISGGDFLTVQHAQRGYEFFKLHGVKNLEIGNGAGNAETVSIGSTPVGVPLKQETAGKIIVGSKVMIIDPETHKEKKYGEEGLLLVSGKHIFKEYYKNPELTAKSKIVINNTEYFNTETLGYIDQDGYFYITGRNSRFYIMSSLNKVYCDKIQNFISYFKYVKDCAVVKVPDNDLLYVNKAYIVLNENYRSCNNIEEIINEMFYMPIQTDAGIVQLKPYEIPSYIEFISELPRKKGTDKVDYALLEKDAIEKLSKSKKLTRLKNV